MSSPSGDRLASSSTETATLADADAREMPTGFTDPRRVLHESSNCGEGQKNVKLDDEKRPFFASSSSSVVCLSSPRGENPEEGNPA